MARPAVAAVIGAATTAFPRPAVLLAQEPDAAGQMRWVAGFGGYAGDHVEPTVEAIAKRAREINSPEIASLAESGESIGAPARYLFEHSQRRRFERMPRFPANFLVMGDALASFNPVYVQGMTVVACEALALQQAIGGSGPLMARQFFRDAARIIDTPWQMAAGSDLQISQAHGPRP
ncbi:MAG: hypothetical protein ABWZ78_09135 [Burkholderiaceae bacterium]